MPRPRLRLPASPGFQFAIAATFSITARARGSFICASRNATGSAFASAAISSMKDSMREHVGVGAERAQRRHPDRHLRDEVMHDLLVREVVERHRVAVAAAGRLRNAAAAGRASAARPCTRPPAHWCRWSIAAASSGCCSTARTASRRSCCRRRARRGRSSTSPRHRAPRRTRRRASIAAAPAGRAPPAPAAPHRAPRRRRRSARSSPSLRHGCSGCPAAASSAPSPARPAAGTHLASGVHTDILPSLNSAIAADGPIEACARYGLV